MVEQTENYYLMNIYVLGNVQGTWVHYSCNQPRCINNTAKTPYEIIIIIFSLNTPLWWKRKLKFGDNKLALINRELKNKLPSIWPQTPSLSLRCYFLSCYWLSYKMCWFCYMGLWLSSDSFTSILIKPWIALSSIFVQVFIENPNYFGCSDLPQITIVSCPSLVFSFTEL